MFISMLAKCRERERDPEQGIAGGDIFVCAFKCRDGRV